MNIINNVKNCIKVIFLFVFLFSFSLANAKNENICGFNGLGNDSSEWKNEFSILLRNESEPGYLVMSRVIGTLAMADNKTLNDPECAVSKYVKELVDFYSEKESDVEKKHEELKPALKLIKSKLNKQDLVEVGNE